MEESKSVCWFRDGRVLTPREEKILARIREVREEYHKLRSLRDELAREDPDSSKLDRLDEELKRLKKERARLDEERQDAARERMKLLGHE